MIIKSLFLVCTGLASVIGVLGAPTLQTRALDVYDGNLELDISDYSLVRRGRRPIAEDKLAGVRRPGMYHEPTICPHLDCKRTSGANNLKTLFTSPQWLNSHCVEFHDGRLPLWWEHPDTVPVPMPTTQPRKRRPGRPRVYNPGENEASLREWKRVSTKNPKAAKRILTEYPPPPLRYVDSHTGEHLGVTEVYAAKLASRKRGRVAETQCNSASPSTAPHTPKQEQVPQTQPFVTNNAGLSTAHAAPLAEEHQVVVPPPVVQDPHDVMMYLVSSPEDNSVHNVDHAAMQHASLASQHHAGHMVSSPQANSADQAVAAQHNVASQKPVTDNEWYPNADHEASWKWWGNLNRW